jgi:hypothetical protein
MPAGLSFDTDTITVSAWVNLTSSDVNSRVFTLSAAADNYVYLTINDGGTPAGISLRWSVPGGTEQSLTTQTQLPVNVWKHITVVTSATLSQIYVDGKLAIQGTSGMTPATLGSSFTGVVGNSGAHTDGIRALVDEFQLYDGSLPETEIHTLAWPKTDYSIYRFNEASGEDIIDGSDRAKNGKLVGGSRVTGVFGGGIKLVNAAATGATQYVDLGAGVLQGCSTAWTFAAWYNAEAVRYSAPIFIALDSEVGATSAVAMFRFAPNYKGGVAGLSLSWYQQNDPPSTSWTTRSAWGTYNLGLAQWHHVAITRSDAVVSYYIDGSDSAVTTTYTGTWGTTAINPDKLANAPQNYLGKNRTVGAGTGATTDSGLDGSLDDVLISCRAYTASEIKHLAYKP